MPDTTSDPTLDIEPGSLLDLCVKLTRTWDKARDLDDEPWDDVAAISDFIHENYPELVRCTK